MKIMDKIKNQIKNNRVFDFNNKELLIMKYIEQNCRVSLKYISKKTKIPLTTVSKTLTKLMKEHNLTLKLEPTGKKVYVRKPVEEKAKKILPLLMADPRITLVTMSKKLKIPVSTLHDVMNRIQQKYYMKGVFKSK